MPIKKLNKKYDIYLGGYNVGKSPNVKNVKLNVEQLTLYVGDEYDFTYTVFPKNGLYDEIEWLSSNTDVLSIDKNGHVIGLKDGVSIVSIKINRSRATCKVTVKDIIKFKDPIVKSILVRNYDTDGDGEISHNEANKVTSIPFPMFTGMPITSFDELAYFKNLKTIGQHAFDSCNKLSSITFPPRLENINKNAFSYCNSLHEVMITPNVKNIGTNAFSDCANLTTVVVNSNIPSKNGTKIFDRCPSLNEIKVPGEYIDDYLNAINWGMLNEEEYLYYSYMITQCFDYTFDFFLS